MPFLDFAIAVAIGALVGLEREKRQEGEDLRGLGGLRTFILLAEAGALAAWLARDLASPSIFAAGAIVIAAAVVSGYVLHARADPSALGLTTEIAALVVYLLGGAVVLGHRSLAVALGVLTSAALAFKQPLHRAVGRIGTDDLLAGLKLLIATFVVLPVLPRRAVDPWGAVNPYEVWWLVILIAGLGMAGYLATRWLGAERGLAVTGLAGGLVSSTAVTLFFARRSRSETATSGLSDALAAGVLLAWAVMFARVAVEVAVVHPPLLAPLLPALSAMGGAAGLAALVMWSRPGPTGGPAGAVEVPLKTPFSLAAALPFAALFTLVLLAVELVQRYLPGGGVYAVAALAGLTDVDAITLSMAEQARGGGETAVSVRAIALAVAANTAVKGGMVAALGSAGLRARVLAATAVIVVAAIVALALA